jgi:putative membrane protein
MNHGEFGRGGWGGEALLPGFILLVLVLAGMALLVVFFLRSTGYFGNSATHQTPRPTPQPHADPSLQLLRERYARGEIDTAEYEERRRRLLDEPASL